MKLQFLPFALSYCLLYWIFLHKVDRLQEVKCHCRVLFVLSLLTFFCFFLQNFAMQLWTWCLCFIWLHWYCEYTPKVLSNCICFSCTCRCVANEMEFCCSCYLGVLLKLSFMIFYRNLNVIVRDGNVLDAEWTRSQPFHCSVTEWSGLEWQMRGVMLRTDKSSPLSVLFKLKSQLVVLHSSEVKLLYSYFICTDKCAPLYKYASIFVSAPQFYDTLM